MFDSIKSFAASLDGKSMGVGAVLGASTLAVAAIVYNRFFNDDVVIEVPETEAPKAKADEPVVDVEAEAKPADDAQAA